MNYLDEVAEKPDCARGSPDADTSRTSTGSITLNTAPRGVLASAHSRPPVRLDDRPADGKPMPMPLGLVV